MKIKNILNKIIRSSKNNKIESDESYCYSQTIWNTKYNFIILLSFTEDYFSDIIELQDAINNIKRLNTKIIYSSYDEKLDKKDKDGNDVWVIHKKHYMLIGGTPYHFSKIYHYIHDLGNRALSKITDEIINNCDDIKFRLLIKDGILSNFINEPKYDTYIKFENEYYDDPDIILKRLPNGFTGKDLFNFINSYGFNGDLLANLDDILNMKIISMTEKNFKLSKYFDIYSSLIKNPTVEKLKMTLEPLYKQPDDDNIPGDVSDESLDEIFREHYEKFSAISDEYIHYEDIDEELADDEESENMHTEDKA